MKVVDFGVAAWIPPQPGLLIAKVRPGTADSSVDAAMSDADCEAAITHGRRLLQALPGNVLLLGEMGIANTSAAALLMCRLTGLPIEDCAGRGTGLSDAGMAHKLVVLRRARGRARPRW